jgi:hypothetical protein
MEKAKEGSQTILATVGYLKIKTFIHAFFPRAIDV